MIGIIGAMDLEIASLKKKLEEPLEEDISGVTFIRGTLYGKEVVLAKCGIGKTFAALCAEAMILRYAPSEIINIGVAGTLTKNLDIGSVAVGSAAVCHDMDTSAIGDPVGLISGINLVEIPLDDEKAECFMALCKKLNIKAEKGIIASGDAFVSEKSKKEWIANQFSAIACEMEGQAIAQVCYVNSTPCSIIRSISDNADGEAMEYELFKNVAAKSATEIIENYLKI